MASGNLETNGDADPSSPDQSKPLKLRLKQSSTVLQSRDGSVKSPSNAALKAGQGKAKDAEDGAADQQDAPLSPLGPIGENGQIRLSNAAGTTSGED